MPLYVTCPHCEHPALIPASHQGRVHRCRQCNAVYTVRKRGRQPAQKQNQGTNPLKRPA